LRLLGQKEESGPGYVIESCVLQEFVFFESLFGGLCPRLVGLYESLEGVVVKSCAFCGHS
jgi:hypothetical protein